MATYSCGLSFVDNRGVQRHLQCVDQRSAIVRGLLFSQFSIVLLDEVILRGLLICTVNLQ